MTGPAAAGGPRGSSPPPLPAISRSAASRASAGLWLLAPLAVGTALRLWNLPAQILGGDEMHAVRAALGSRLPEILVTYRQADNCIPLTAIYRLVLDAGGSLTEMVLRLPVLLAGILLAAIAPLWIDRRVGRRTGRRLRLAARRVARRRALQPDRPLLHADAPPGRRGGRRLRGLLAHAPAALGGGLRGARGVRPLVPPRIGALRGGAAALRGRRSAAWPKAPPRRPPRQPPGGPRHAARRAGGAGGDSPRARRRLRALPAAGPRDARRVGRHQAAGAVDPPLHGARRHAAPGGNGRRAASRRSSGGSPSGGSLSSRRAGRASGSTP